MLKTAMLTVAAFAFTIGTAAAQDLIDGSDTDQILAIAQQYGEAELKRASDGSPMIEAEMDGILYQVYFLNCTKGKRCEDINFYAGFMDTSPSLEEINDWNYNKRFSRAYLDEDRDACIEMDVDLVAGVTTDYIDSQFGLWQLVLGQYIEHIDY